MSTFETSNIERFKQQIDAEWTDPALIAAYRKWGGHEAETFRAATNRIVEAADVKPGMHVLDLASGSGEPALALARAVGPNGKVTATDLAAELLDIAEEYARKQGLTNMAFRQADAHELPFPDQTFDRVTARFGVMYFDDHVQALRECHRVLKLKLGGRAAFMAWTSPDKQGFVTSTIGPLSQYIQLPDDEPGAPGPFKFADGGTLSAALKTAGFQHVQEERHVLPARFPGSPEAFSEYFVEMSPPFRPIIDAIEAGKREQAIGDVLTALRNDYDGRFVNHSTEVVVASGLC